MRTTITALLLAFAFAGAAAEDDTGKDKEPPKENTGPGCGNSASIRTAIEIIRKEHFPSKEDWKAELVNVRTMAMKRELGGYLCAATLRYETKVADLILKPRPDGGFDSEGVWVDKIKEASVRFEIHPDAVDPDKTIVSVHRARALDL